MSYWIGQLLLWAGFIAAAFVTVRQEEVADDKWATIEWGWYGFAMAVGIVGAIAIRASKKSAQGSDDRVQAQFSTLTTCLDQLTAAVGELRANCDTAAPSEFVKEIDALCAEPFAEFADARNALVQRFWTTGVCRHHDRFCKWRTVRQPSLVGFGGRVYERVGGQSRKGRNASDDGP